MIPTVLSFLGLHFITFTYLNVCMNEWASAGFIFAATGLVRKAKLARRAPGSDHAVLARLSRTWFNLNAG
jgi:hypothetical protein